MENLDYLAQTRMISMKKESLPHRLGSLRHLRTTVELRAENATIQAYIAKVPVKAANDVLK